MVLWTLIAVLTGVAALAALWPLARRTPATAATQSDVAIYKDQLAEIERDRARNLIPAEEAEAARIEVSRRLIGAASRDTPELAPSTLRRRVAAVAVLLAVPAVALGLYGRLGSPKLPDQPLQARLDTPSENASLEQLVVEVETHLARNPDDGRGWEVIAPIYLKAGRFAQARQAYANAVRLLGSTGEREASVGEAATAAADGVVTADARAAFERAVGKDPANAKARYFLGRAREQDGDKAGAISEWGKLLAIQQTGTPIAAFLRREISRLGGQLPAKASTEAPQRGPNAEAVAAAEKMTPQDRAAMIEGMVAGLAARLKDGGGQLDDWLKLVRAYSVLGQKDKAIAAAADARRALAASPDQVRRLDDLVKSLGLEG
jgi:cytochrome c-type biogenesis protein CcmH